MKSSGRGLFMSVGKLFVLFVMWLFGRCLWGLRSIWRCVRSFRMYLSVSIVGSSLSLKLVLIIILWLSIVLSFLILRFLRGVSRRSVSGCVRC